MTDFNIALSIAQVDPLCLESSVEEIVSGGIDEIRFEIYDNHFAPGFGPSLNIVHAIKKAFPVPCHVHLMAEQPDTCIDMIAATGCESLTVHVEASTHIHRTLDSIRNAGMSAGLAINPASPLTRLDYLLPSADRFVLCLLEPGESTPAPNAFSGTVERTRLLRENIRHRNLSARIEVAGNISPHQAAMLIYHGADVIAPGAGLFQEESPRKEAARNYRRTVEAKLLSL